MIDVGAVIRAYLMDQPALGGVTIVAGDRLPDGYNPGVSGPVIVLGTRGGAQAYHSRTLQPSVQYRCYATTEAAAAALASVLVEVLNDQVGAGLKQSRLETLPQPLTDPETSWPFVLLAFRHWLVNDEEM